MRRCHFELAAGLTPSRALALSTGVVGRQLAVGVIAGGEGHEQHGAIRALLEASQRRTLQESRNPAVATHSHDEQTHSVDLRRVCEHVGGAADRGGVQLEAGVQPVAAQI